MRVCSTLVLLSLFLSAPATVLGNWGLEVGRADAGDVVGLVSDWLSFKKERRRLDRATLAGMTMIARQRQLIGIAEKDLPPQQMFEKLEEYWLNNLVAPLQGIARNPAAACAEAQFALTNFIGMKRQQQLLGLAESERLNGEYQVTEELASLRCRDEALDECVATGRFTQILQLKVAWDRQAQMYNREDTLDSWAEDALKQCAIYELHFVSTSRSSVTLPRPAVRPAEVETVRDGQVQIRLELPPGGLKSAIRIPLGEALKGETAGGNNPFFVSVKCKSPMKEVDWICNPHADSSPIKVRINALDLGHREFYIAYVKDELQAFYEEWPETEVTKERFVGEDKFSFEFEGGEFHLKGLLKHFSGATSDLPMDDQESAFYMAHKKDWVSSNRLSIDSSKRGVYPVIFQFTYADKHTAPPRILFTDSTEFELIHKPKPEPFEKVPEPIRKPLKPPPDK